MKVFIRVITVLLTIVIIGFVFIYLSPHYNMYLVRSESMKPAINMGDMVITGPLNNPLSGEIKPGSIVTYLRGEELVTHRVISIDGDILVTKGDAVEDPDALPVNLSSVAGVYLFKIPYLGYVSNYIRTKVGWFTVIIIPSIVLLVLLFRSVSKELKNRSTDKRTVQDKGVISEEHYIDRT